MMNTVKNQKIALLFVFMGCISAVSGQQSTRLGLGLESFSSGNTHGTFFRPYAGYEWGGNFISGGPLIHKASSMIKGVKFEYSRNLSASGDKYTPNAKGMYIFDLLQLNILVHVQYNAPLTMSNFVVNEEQNVSRVKDKDWSKATLATAEAGFGFEARVNLTKNITWRSSSSASVHYHTSYVKGLSRERMAPSLALCTGLLFILE